MRHKREIMWWAAACAAAVGLSALVGGFIGPIVALFALVLLAGAILIEFEGPQAVAAVEDYLDDAPAPPAEPEPAAPVADPQGLDEPVTPTDAGQTADADEAEVTAEVEPEVEADAEGGAERTEAAEHRATASA